MFKVNDIILTIDLEDHQDVVVITCIDNGIWSKGYLDDTEIFESFETILNEYNTWVKVGSIDKP